MRILICLFATVASLLPLAGCTPKSTPATAIDGGIDASAKASKDSAAEANSDLQPPADNSLSLADYITAGAPAPDRSWGGDDMARASSILVGIGQKNAELLPRYQSKRSGDIFRRLTSDENLDLYRNHSLPIEQRLPDALKYMQATNDLLKLYLGGFNQQAVGDSELIELTGASLRVAVVMLKLSEEFLPTLDKNDPTYPVRLQGFESVKNGMATMVAGCLQTLTESNAYRTSELKRLAKYLEATLPELLPHLTEESRMETLVRLRAFQNDPAMQKLKPELDWLVAVAGESVSASKER